MRVIPRAPGAHRPAWNWALALMVLLAGVMIAWLGNRLPDPAPENAPASRFSATRAMHDVRAIAARPHPIGSPEIADTRRYLLRRMSELGLAPQMRNQTVVVTRRTSADLAIGGKVRNIVGALQGTEPSLPAILLMAHYDTAPLSPGAGDDTAGVAVALEVIRAIRASGPQRRSIFVLFTDGEEAGLLGANAFFRQDPLRKHVGIVLNMEARGDSGKALMFQTSPGNRSLIDAYRRSVASPSADSLLVSIYKRMPNDTDLTTALEHRHAGMNFAFLGHQMAYHTPLSTPAALNAGSLQHMGDQVLPLTHALANAAAPPGNSGDVAFADIPGRYLIAYPLWMGWALTLAAVAATGGLIAAGIARQHIVWRDLLAGAATLVMLLPAITTALMLVVRIAAFLLRDVLSPYALVGQIDLLLPALVLTGLGTGMLGLYASGRGRRWGPALLWLVCGGLAAVLGPFTLLPLITGTVAALVGLWATSRQSAFAGWFAGAIALLAVLALVAQIVMPNGAHALVWPLLLLLPVLALRLFAPTWAGRPVGVFAAAVAAMLVAGLMARSGYDLFIMAGLTVPSLIAPFLLLTSLAVAPILWRVRGLAITALSCILIGLMLSLTAGLRGRTPSVASPEMIEPFQIVDPARGIAQWASARQDRGGWTAKLLRSGGDTPALRSAIPLMKERIWVADAGPQALARPELTIERQGAGQGRGGAQRIVVTARGANGGRYFRLYLKPIVDLEGLKLMGHPVAGKVKAHQWSQLVVHASGTDPVLLEMPAASAGALMARMVEVRDDWPALQAAMPLPPEVIPYRRAGNVMILSSARLKW